ncbi:MAG: rhomboid family intramembrane serine protease [Chitinophagales bacterium]
MENITEKEEEKKRITVSMLIPLYFVSVLWLVYFTEYATGLDFSWLGILPRTFGGLGGIIFTPFLHGSFGHLLSNTVPLLVLGFGLIYFYRSIAYKVFLWIWFIDGFGVWILGRESYHIGASGLVYGMAAFLIFSGILRSNRRLLALSMAVVFVYGSLIWGMLPYIPDVSWEAHLFGFLAGVYFSVHYLRDGPANDPLPEWMSETDDEKERLQEYSGNELRPEEKISTDEESAKPSDEIKIRYIYRSKEDEKESVD